MIRRDLIMTPRRATYRSLDRFVRPILITDTARLTARDYSIYHSRELLSLRPVVLDTETTGLDNRAEICEVAAISSMTERVLVDTLVKPFNPIPSDATRIHGITNADVHHAPQFSQVMFGNLGELLDDTTISICIYNAEYDLRLIDQSLGIGRRYQYRDNIHCVMELYALFFGAWNEWHRNYTWQSLENAARQTGLYFQGNAHSALADARMALAVLRYMAASYTSLEVPEPDIWYHSRNSR